MKPVENCLEELEDSSLSEDTVELSCDAIGFTVGFHQLLTDIGVLTNKELDCAAMEKAVESFFGELSAAGIFLASFREADKILMDTYTSLKTKKAAGEDDVPELLIEGYRKLAQRVARTRERLVEGPADSDLTP